MTMPAIASPALYERAACRIARADQRLERGQSAAIAVPSFFPSTRRADPARRFASPASYRRDVFRRFAAAIALDLRRELTPLRDPNTTNTLKSLENFLDLTLRCRRGTRMIADVSAHWRVRARSVSGRLGHL